MVNTYEQEARQAKVGRLVMVLKRYDPEDVAEMPEEGWKYAERMAGVRPSSTLTRDEVVRVLRQKSEGAMQ